ncbi:MAG: hypothetical protein ACKOCT_11090 [Alphaproteobacteria bacterium]
MARPRKTTDIVSTLRGEAARVIEALDGEIAKRRKELAELVAHADAWRATLGGRISAALGELGGKRAKAPRAKKGRPRGGKRVSWDAVLASLPESFTIEDVLKNPDAARKGRAQIYPALNRWEASKVIKCVAKGRYKRVAGAEKATAAAAPKPKPKAKAKAKRGRPAKRAA